MIIIIINTYITYYMESMNITMTQQKNGTIHKVVQGEGLFFSIFLLWNNILTKCRQQVIICIVITPIADNSVIPRATILLLSVLFKWLLQVKQKKNIHNTYKKKSPNLNYIFICTHIYTEYSYKPHMFV